MKNRSGIISVLLGLAVMGGLALAAFLYGGQLMARAEAFFGPPADGLGFVQQVQLGLELGRKGEALLEAAGSEAEERVFVIESGESIDSILARLAAAGFVQDSDLLRTYLIYKGLDRNVQAGQFGLAKAMNAIEVAEALLDPTPGEITLSILAGWRLEEIAASLASAGFGFSEAAFLEAAYASADDFDFLAWLPEGQNLEGYFLAGQYKMEREVDAGGLVHRLLTAMGSELSTELLEGFRQQGLNLHEALTLASIVEREAVLEEEMGLIAGVFVKRLGAGMRLEADPTVQYALGFDDASQSWWTHPLLTEHLQVQSAYNTYVAERLPPGPIASPSLAALEAVASPEESPYFFFQAACDGSGKHVFAVTYEEHVGNNCP